MGDSRCASCAAPVATGTHCDACLAVASTVVGEVAPPTTGGRPAAKRKTADDLIGTEVIGQYVIRSLLGKGGMGAVYLADQATVGRRAVIKVLHPVHSADPGSQTRFETEARAASQLNHPNIVTIYNYGAMTDGTLFLAMEHLDGKTLEQAAKKRLPVTRAVNIVTQIADALGEAHRHGVVHRDVKPSNVMLVERAQADDVVKVLDFGIARVDGARVTATGAVCGTPTYMSPEQIRGRQVDGRSDLYSLGCILFELITGRPPFEGEATVGLAYMHAHEPPPRASELAPKSNVPPALDEFLMRALAKDPKDRPRDAAGFNKELRAAMEPAKVEVTSKPKADPTPTPKAKADPKPKPDPTPPKPVRQKADTPPKPLPTAPSMLARLTQAAPVRSPKTTKTGPVKRAKQGGWARLRRVFQRRKPWAERMLGRVRSFGRARKPQRKWAWIAIAVLLGIALVGAGWFALSKSDDKQTVARPAKPADAPPPARPPAKPTRKKTTRTN